jgi:hypothetical protein
MNYETYDNQENNKFSCKSFLRKFVQNYSALRTSSKFIKTIEFWKLFLFPSSSEQATKQKIALLFVFLPKYN